MLISHESALFWLEMPRFDLKSFCARKKVLRDEVVMKYRRIKEAENDIKNLDDKLKVMRAEIDKKTHKCKRLDNKVCQ